MNRYWRFLLRMYPAGFRSEYGAEIVSGWRLAWQNTAKTGRAWLLASALSDSLLNAFLVHFEIFALDLKLAIRGSARAWPFALTVVLTIAIGIGANTAVFALVNHVLLQPLPFAHPDRLLSLVEIQGAPDNWNQLSPANYRDWKAAASDFDAMGAWTSVGANLTGTGEPVHLTGAAITASLLPTLGATPQIGRGFSTEDERPGAPPTVILSQATWRSQFGGDSAILGRAINLDGAATTVIGVMPASFVYPSPQAQIWQPFPFAPGDFADRSNTYLNVVGRLKPDATSAAAQEQLQTIAGRLERQYPRDLAHISAAVIPLAGFIRPQTRILLWSLMGAALCVLLLAWLNLASLVAARTLGRRSELAIRAALGAGAERLTRQLATEGLLLAFSGGLAGILLGASLLPLLARLVPPTLPIAAQPSLDGRVLIFALLATAAVGLGFSMAPARNVGTVHLAVDLGDARGLPRRRGRAAIVAEVGGCMLLLVLAGLLARAVLKLQAEPVGFDTSHAMSLRTSLPQPEYASPARRQHFYDAVTTAAQALPGVTAVGFITGLPMELTFGVWPVGIPGRVLPPAELPQASLRLITPGYFAAMAIPRLSGRTFAASDAPDAAKVAVVSASLTHALPGGLHLGRTIVVAGQPRLIVGIVGDVRVRGLERRSEPQIYLPAGQAQDDVAPWYYPADLVVRSKADDPMALAGALRRIVHAADPGQPVTHVQALSALIAAQTLERRTQLALLAAFAALACLLAMLGIYALLAGRVRARTREIGVRLALGAGHIRLLRAILGEGAALGLAGIALGAIVGLACTRFLTSLLVGLGPADAISYAAAAGLCLLMTLMGSLLPALSAIRVDPLDALKSSG